MYGFVAAHGRGSYRLGSSPADGITASLTAVDVFDGKPYKLAADSGRSFMGIQRLRTGLLYQPEEAEDLIQRDPRNGDILFPYLNGDDLNLVGVDQSPSRWVIDFRDCHT